MKLKAYTFVFLQFVSLFAILFTAPLMAYSIHGLLLEGGGVFIGVLAILTMRIGNFNVAPLPKQGGVIITKGVYKYLRHPMYLAQLLAVAGLVADYFSWFRLAVLILLAITLLFKLHFEERQLIPHYAGYEVYMKKSLRLIPYIY
jgi:protein-S-isoprenylcysteine O-methyltransferase Ste14